MLTSKELGLPTQKFARDYIKPLDKLTLPELKLLLSRQEKILNLSKLRSDLANKLETSINRIKKLIKDKETFIEKFDSIQIHEYDVNENVDFISGKREFKPYECKKEAQMLAETTSMLPILSLEETKSILKLSDIKLMDKTIELKDISIYRDHRDSFSDIDSDDDAIGITIDSD